MVTRTVRPPAKTNSSRTNSTVACTFPYFPCYCFLWCFSLLDKLLTQEAYLPRVLPSFSSGKCSLAKGVCGCGVTYEEITPQNTSVTCIPVSLDLKPLYLPTKFIYLLDMFNKMKSISFCRCNKTRKKRIK